MNNLLNRKIERDAFIAEVDVDVIPGVEERQFNHVFF